MSFSFKRGAPEADMVLDVRFLTNPYYDPALSHKNGLDAAVGEYIERDPLFSEFLEGLSRLLEPLLPRFSEKGRSGLAIAIGCTGGQHRSVYVTQKLGGFLQALGYNVSIRHRELEQKT